MDIIQSTVPEYRHWAMKGIHMWLVFQFTLGHFIHQNLRSNNHCGWLASEQLNQFQALHHAQICSPTEFSWNRRTLLFWLCFLLTPGKKVTLFWFEIVANLRGGIPFHTIIYSFQYKWIYPLAVNFPCNFGLESVLIISSLNRNFQTLSRVLQYRHPKGPQTAINQMPKSTEVSGTLPRPLGTLMPLKYDPMQFYQFQRASNSHVTSQDQFIKQESKIC